MTELPMYVNCDNQKIEHCDFYVHHKCPETCGFARDIKSGIGAICDGDLVKKIREVNDEVA